MRNGLVVRKSEIEGRGIITSQSFRQGEAIIRLHGIEVFGHYAPSDAPFDPMMIGIGIGHWLKPTKQSIWRWLNHSCLPNVGFRDARTIVALRKIEAGDEILIDYSMTEADPWWCMKCHCGAPKCRYNIRAFQHIPIHVQKIYRPHIAPWLRQVADIYIDTPRQAADIVVAFRSGAAAAFPTESFYGIGVVATDAHAIHDLFHIKQREPGKPIALIAADLKQVKNFFIMSKAEEKLAAKHWPGPLTILLTPKKTIAAKALGARKIGVRVPAHTGARRLAEQVGAPLTATSANISGQPPTKSARVVKRNFPGILLVPGRCGQETLPSTIVEISKTNINIIRPGTLNLSQYARVPGNATHV